MGDRTPPPATSRGHLGGGWDGPKGMGRTKPENDPFFQKKGGP